MLNSDHQQLLYTLLRDLIRVPSPSGREKECALLAQKYMRQLDFDDANSDIFGNIIGLKDFGGNGPALLMDAHLDHAGVSDVERWTHYPYGGDLNDGRIWGRGAIDNKGALAAMLMAAHLAALDPAGLRGRLYVVGTVYNKLMEGVSSASLVEMCRPDYVIIGEGSDHLIMHGQRGRTEIFLETRGRTALTAMPRWGVNGVEKMIRLINEIEQEFRNLPRHPLLGEVSMELTEINSSPYIEVNVIPDYCRARFDFRFPVGRSKSEILSRIKSTILAMSSVDESFEADVYLPIKEFRCYTGVSISTDAYWPAWLLDENHPLVQAACRGLSQVGLTPKKSVYPFSTNASYYAGVLGLPTIGFGPRPIGMYHQVDENIATADLLELCLGYYGLIRSVLSG